MRGRRRQDHADGRTDFLLIVAVASLEDYQRFSDEVLATDECADVRDAGRLREIVRFDPLRMDRLI